MPSPCFSFLFKLSIFGQNAPKKAARRGDDGYKVVSVRMREGLIERLDELSERTNRSRNELINLLLEAAISIVKVEE